MSASHSVIHNDKNDNILIGMRNGRTGEFKLVPKEQATVSVFDSSVLLGGKSPPPSDTFLNLSIVSQTDFGRVSEPTMVLCNMPKSISTGSMTAPKLS